MRKKKSVIKRLLEIAEFKPLHGDYTSLATRCGVTRQLFDYHKNKNTNSIPSFAAVLSRELKISDHTFVQILYEWRV